jgi:tRNA threonylcarbamoyladenosine modification (KEOPS) complex  Pcc1 subunit
MKNLKKIIALLGIIFISCENNDTAINETCDSNAEVISETIFKDINTLNYGVSDVKLNGNCLEITISSSGCDAGQWQMILYSTNELYTVYPYQRAVKVKLVNNQLCLAVFQKTKSFDLTPFQLKGQNQIPLNIAGWNKTILYKY